MCSYILHCFVVNVAIILLKNTLYKSKIPCFSAYVENSGGICSGRFVWSIPLGTVLAPTFKDEPRRPWMFSSVATKQR